jgi:isopenicillin N synthase-like dioxygenase
VRQVREEALHIAPDHIPVISLAAIGTGAAAVRAIGQAMLQAAETIGFFYIREHAIPETLIAEVMRHSAAFFAAPMADKQAVKVNASHRGFIAMGEAKMTGGKRPDLKESFVWGCDAGEAAGAAPNQWPASPPTMRAVLERFLEAGNQVGWQLLAAFAAALDLPLDRFVRGIDRPASRGSIIYYPPQEPEIEADQFGVSPHTDYGCLTLLHQDGTGGLAVQGRDGDWLKAPPIPGTIVVNVGDLLARWTNDRFRSTPHRVVNRSGHARYSTAIFVDPNPDTVIEPVVAPGDVAHYEPVTCGDYLRGRFDATFAYRRSSAA